MDFNYFTANATNLSGSDVSYGLLIAPQQLDIWFALFIFITGNISSIGNFIVFSSRTFRARACSIYLIFESMFTFIYFNYVLVTRMIQKGFLIPIIDHYDPVCKIREFLSEYVHQVAFTLFTFATIDRFLSTHRSVGMYNYTASEMIGYLDKLPRYSRKC
jgi:hypothetical protein